MRVWEPRLFIGSRPNSLSDFGGAGRMVEVLPRFSPCLHAVIPLWGDRVLFQLFSPALRDQVFSFFPKNPCHPAIRGPAPRDAFSVPLCLGGPKLRTDPLRVINSKPFTQGRQYPMHFVRRQCAQSAFKFDDRDGLNLLQMKRTRF